MISEIPLNVKLEITNPNVEEGTTETIVEPGQLIYFRYFSNDVGVSNLKIFEYELSLNRCK